MPFVARLQKKSCNLHFRTPGLDIHAATPEFDDFAADLDVTVPSHMKHEMAWSRDGFALTYSYAARNYASRFN